MAERKTTQRILVGTLVVSTLILAGTTAWFGWTVWRQNQGLRPTVLPQRTPSPMERRAALGANGDETGVRRVLYFQGMDQSTLIPEHRSLPRTELVQESVRQVLDALISGPHTELLPVIPKNVTVRGVFWDNATGFVIVDFSEEILSEHPGQLNAEWATLFGVTNTVISTDKRIKAVQILVEGRVLESEDTVWDWSLPYELNLSFVPIGL